MKLSPVDRINLLNSLPQKGNPTTLRIRRDLEAALSFTEEEHKLFIIDIKLRTGEIFEKFNPDTINTLKDVFIGEKARDLIIDELAKLGKEAELPRSMLDIYERFVEGQKTLEDLADEAAAAKMKEASKDVVLSGGPAASGL